MKNQLYLKKDDDFFICLQHFEGEEAPVLSCEEGSSRKRTRWQPGARLPKNLKETLMKMRKSVVNHQDDEEEDMGINSRVTHPEEVADLFEEEDSDEDNEEDMQTVEFLDSETDKLGSGYIVEGSEDSMPIEDNDGAWTEPSSQESEYYESGPSQSSTCSESADTFKGRIHYVSYIYIDHWEP